MPIIATRSPYSCYQRGLARERLSDIEQHPLHVMIRCVDDLPMPTPGMWEAKQRVFADCLERARCIYLLDADLVLTSAVDDVFDLAAQGWIVSSADGGPKRYDESYAVYRSELPGQTHPYVNSGALCLDVRRRVSPCRLRRSSGWTIAFCPRLTTVSSALTGGRPEILRSMHDGLVSGREMVVASFYARHPAWEGSFRLCCNGIFFGGAAHPDGEWEYVDGGDRLRLKWFSWPEDVLKKTDFGYVSGGQFRLDWPARI